MEKVERERIICVKVKGDSLAVVCDIFRIIIVYSLFL